MRKFFITVAVVAVVVVLGSIDVFAAIIIIIIIVVIVVGFEVAVAGVLAEVVVRTDRVVSACGGHWQHCFRTESVVGLVGFTSMFSSVPGLITLPSGGSRICFCDTIR